MRIAHLFTCSEQRILKFTAYHIRCSILFNTLNFYIMDLNQYFENFQDAYNDAICKIITLREQAQEIREQMYSIIDSCENIENEF